jgi:lysophospholipid acyltransferase (LPLAT)-like uncharacterized protein
MKQWIRKHILPPLVVFIIRAINSTIRVRMVDPHGVMGWATKTNFIGAYWHNRILVLPCYYEKYLGHHPMLTLNSLSSDGQLMADILKHFNVKAVRGSTSRRGTEAFLELLRELKENGKSVSITPDGPRGPRYHAQMGIIALAKLSGLPIVPIVWESERKWVITRSWDHFQIPKPFTRAECRFPEPIRVSPDAEPEEMERCRLLLEERLGGED